MDALPLLSIRTHVKARVTSTVLTGWDLFLRISINDCTTLVLIPALMTSRAILDSYSDLNFSKSAVIIDPCVKGIYKKVNKLGIVYAYYSANLAHLSVFTAGSFYTESGMTQIRTSLFTTSVSAGLTYQSETKLAQHSNPSTGNFGNKLVLGMTPITILLLFYSPHS